MAPAAASAGPFAAASKHFARRLLTIVENRLELLMLEMQEERGRLVRAILLALGVATLALPAAHPPSTQVHASTGAQSCAEASRFGYQTVVMVNMTTRIWLRFQRNLLHGGYRKSEKRWTLKLRFLTSKWFTGVGFDLL